MANQSDEALVRSKRIKEAAERFAREHVQSFEVPGRKVELIRLAMLEGGQIALEVHADFIPK
jgi:hypothetical protein